MSARMIFIAHALVAPGCLTGTAAIPQWPCVDDGHGRMGPDARPGRPGYSAGKLWSALRLVVCIGDGKDTDGWIYAWPNRPHMAALPSCFCRRESWLGLPTECERSYLPSA